MTTDPRLAGTVLTGGLLLAPLAFGGVDNGRATLRVGGSEVTCAQGGKVEAGPLALECTEVTDDPVKLTAPPG